ncbi:MAG: M20/M25/M40 family metallo-hydrolase [Gammaproteobacteria bacterium]
MFELGAVRDYGVRNSSDILVFADRMNATPLWLTGNTDSIYALLVLDLKKDGPTVIGIMTEYDALPGLGNEPVAEKTPRKDGNTSGHGCGHNLIGAGGLGAAIALKEWMEKNKIPGTLRVFGAVAEESEGAKIYMARDGVFDLLLTG